MWSATACAATQGDVVRPGGPGEVDTDEAPLATAASARERRPGATEVDDDAAVRADEPGPSPRAPGSRPLTINGRMQQRCRAHRAVVEQAGSRAGLDPVLLLAIAWVESGFNAEAESPAGAVGLMQLIPTTSARMGCNDPGDPECAAAAAAAYMKRLLRQFDGQLVYALCAYHAGPVRPMRSFRAGVLPANVGYAERVLEARSRLERYGCQGR